MYLLTSFLLPSCPVQAIITPPLTETISVAVSQTFAVMGLNTGFIQAASMARGNISTFFPLKVEVKFDIPNANFKIQAFPIVLPVHAVTARYRIF